MAPIVTLLTDFGTRDAYVAAMKGVLLRIAPEATLVDISHEVPPQGVAEAAYLLGEASRWFPPGTVHLVVVDPGVGGARRGLAVRSGGQSFVAPDNGVLTRVLCRDKAERIVELVEPRYRLPVVSPTFHGRDVFAPAAAHLARGVPLEGFGPLVDDPVLLDWAKPRLLAGEVIVGHVVHVDRFGNLVTDIPPDLIGDPERAVVSVGELRVRGVRATYSQVARGEALALVGSHGHLEVAVREGSAAEVARARAGDKVRVERV